MATEIELIALEKLKSLLFELNDKIVENNDSPKREVQYVLPFMKTPLHKAIKIVEAIEKNSKH